MSSGDDVEGEEEEEEEEDEEEEDVGTVGTARSKGRVPAGRSGEREDEDEGNGVGGGANGTAAGGQVAAGKGKKRRSAARQVEDDVDSSDASDDEQVAAGKRRLVAAGGDASSSKLSDPYEEHVGRMMTDAEVAALTADKPQFKVEALAEGVSGGKWVTTRLHLPETECQLAGLSMKARLRAHWQALHQKSSGKAKLAKKKKSKNESSHGSSSAAGGTSSAGSHGCPPDAEDSDFASRAQAQFFSLCGSYADVLHSHRPSPQSRTGTPADAAHITDAYLLHVLNHILKTRDRVAKNNDRLSRHYASGAAAGANKGQPGKRIKGGKTLKKVDKEKREEEEAKGEDTEGEEAEEGEGEQQDKEEGEEKEGREEAGRREGEAEGEGEGEGEGEEMEPPRDQGFTRPKVLLLLPFRSTALRVVERLLHLCPPSQK
eukprot:jgi/Mesen1/4638/ME000241S03678